MTLRQKALLILEIFDEPIEPNAYTEALVVAIVKVLRRKK